MLRDSAMHHLNDKHLPIEQVKAILDAFKGDTVIEASVAMNISLRTSIYDKEREKSSTMCDILAYLATSSDMSARWAVAKNPHTSPAILEHLSHDTINLVRALVATNPSTPKPMLQRLFGDEKIVRDGLSGNPSTPLKYLTILADDNDPMVRLRVIENPSCNELICAKMLKDTSENVRIAAHAKLKRLHHE